MIKKILGLGAILIMSFGLFAGCNNIDHNAVLYDNASEWMRSDFLESNMTQGAGPYNEEPPANAETLPENRTYIVDDSVKFDEIFIEFPHEISFESEMLVVYITTNFYMGNSYKLINLTVQDGVLNAEMKRGGVSTVAHAASAPRQRCFVIKMDKQNITETNITVK